MSDLGSQIVNTIAAYEKGITYESQKKAGKKDITLIPMKHCPPPLFKNPTVISQEIANLMFFAGWIAIPLFAIGYAITNCFIKALRNCSVHINEVKKTKITGNTALEYTSQEKRQLALEKFNSLKTENGRESAFKFIAAQDKDGKTYFHHLFELKENPQIAGETGLLAWKRAIEDPNKLIELMNIEDNNGQTPLSIAIERGYTLSFLYPIVPDKTAISQPNELIVSSAWHIKQAMVKTIQALANPESRKELMNQCPGEFEYDKIDHIVTYLHRLMCYGHGKDLILAVDCCENPTNLPEQLLALYRYVKENPNLPLYDSLCQECRDLRTEEEIDMKYAEWGIVAKKREPSIWVSFSSIKNESEPEKGRLQVLIEKTLSENNESKKNGLYNLLSEILDYFAPYNNRVDFFKEENSGILHRLADFSIKNSGINQDDLKSIVKMLIIKNPDFMKQAVDGKTILEYLNEKNETPIIQAMKEAIHEVSQNLDEKLFEMMTKASMKFYLENKGKEIRETQDELNP